MRVLTNSGFLTVGPFFVLGLRAIFLHPAPLRLVRGLNPFWLLLASPIANLLASKITYHANYFALHSFELVRGHSMELCEVERAELISA